MVAGERDLVDHGVFGGHLALLHLERRKKGVEGRKGKEEDVRSE